MKKTFLIIPIVLTSVFASIKAQANLFYADTFSYSDGALTNLSAPLWQAHSGGGATPVLVSSGKISLNQGSGSREDVNRATGVTMGAGETWYAGFDVSVTGGNTVAYFAHFLEGTSTFGSRVFVTNSAVVGGDFSFGIGNGSNPSSTWASPLSFATTYRLIVSYEFDTGVGKLWINPTQESDTAISTTGFASDNMIAFALRQGAGNSTQVIDNLAVGTTFADALTVPEPSSFALFGLGVTALLVRRRK